MYDDFLTTRCRASVSLESPAGDIDLEDIAYALGNTCRFNGHAPWSVLQHSYLVAAILFENGYHHDDYPGAYFWALVHDASEAYIGDMIRPVFSALSPFAKREIRTLHNRFTDAIIDAAGLPRQGIPGVGLITEPDTVALYMEAEHFFPHRAPWAIDSSPFLQDWAKPWGIIGNLAQDSNLPEKWVGDTQEMAREIKEAE